LQTLVWVVAVPPITGSLGLDHERSQGKIIMIST